MKKTSKWPSRVFNLLMVLAMVISLSAILVAPPVAAQNLACTPWHPYDGCHLAVAVNTYVKDADGKFAPLPIVDYVPTVAPDDCFYVNAVVVNDGNGTALGPITATISWKDEGLITSGIRLATGEGNYTKTWEGNLTGSAPSGPNAIADFWWLVCCNSANGGNYITVSATSASECDNKGPATGCTYVNQGLKGVTRCLDIKIVEAPGMQDVVGKKLDDQGHPVVYHSSVPNTVNPCTTFGIKAEITNNCNCTITNMQALINIIGQAKVVDGDPSSWPVGTDGSLAPGNTTVVGWMLHCEDVGTGIVDISVNATGYTTCPAVYSGSLDDITTALDPLSTHYGENTWRMYQTTPGGLAIEITDPKPQYDCNDNPIPIVIPTGCNQNRFPVTVKVTNTGNDPLNNVNVWMAVDPAHNWVTLPGITNHTWGSLAGHHSESWTFGNFTCSGNGTGNITANASANDVATVSTGINDPVTIVQKDVVASIAPVVLVGGEPDWPIANPVNPKAVNQCQEFGVAFRYTNYLPNDWELNTDNITVCINWADNTSAELVGPAYYRRIETGIAGTWVPLPGFAGGNETSGQYCEQIPWTKQAPAICHCCAFDVLWVFQCEQADNTVVFNSTINVQLASDGNYTDTSGPLCVEQQWKAHLTSSVFFFVQDTETGVMTNQGAVVPNTYFHVVIPVVNTGEADANDVQVYFTVTGAPSGSFQYISYSGDVESMDHTAGSQVFTAHLGTIYGTDYCGPNAKKIILLLKCLGEGEVDVTVPTDKGGTWASEQTDQDGNPLTTAVGVRGYDENSGTWVPQANIVVPNCPEVLFQIPFSLVMENPQTCQTFNQGEVFPVKALITNGGTVGINGVIATINICGNATMSTSGNATLVDPQVKWTDGYGCEHGNKTVGNITPGGSYEAVWMLQCTGAGDVYINVSAAVPNRNITAITLTTVIVHQIAIPTACLDVAIMSPDAWQNGQEWDSSHMHAMIATGQQFALSAMIENDGRNDAANVVVTINPADCPDSLHYVSLAQGQSDTISLGTIPAGNHTMVTWTLVGGSTHDWGFKDCNVRTDDICVEANSTTPEFCDSASALGSGGQVVSDTVRVSVYPAAFLVTTIDTPSTTAVLGDKFTVNYTITNYGVADAWNTSVTLSADNSDVHVAVPGGYTQAIGTIRGWSFGAPYNSVSGNFTLQGSAQGLSTLTVTPSGDDECGWQQVLGYATDNGEMTPEYSWIQSAGTPVQSRFLIPASGTIALSATGACPDLTRVDITLNPGWNLISLPLMPTNGNISALFSGKPVNAIWAYSGGAWHYYGDGVLTALTDGRGYWVHVTGTATTSIRVDGVVNPVPACPSCAPDAPPTYAVAAGWNLIGFKSTCASKASDYLGSSVTWVKMWGYADNAWIQVHSDTMLRPGLGYWIAATNAGTIYP